MTVAEACAETRKQMLCSDEACEIIETLVPVRATDPKARESA